jgi:spore maturation protein CgeB
MAKILWFGLEAVLGIEHEHEVLIMNKASFDTEKVLAFKPDILIEREFNDAVSMYESEVAFTKRMFPKCKTAVWLIDTHVQHTRHKEYAKIFDFVFLAISKYVPEFEKISPAICVFWLPLGFPCPTIPELAKEKKYTIGFVGRFNCRYMEDRTQFLREIKDQYKRLCHFVTDYRDVYQTMSECNIMINKSISDDMNFRVFEALGVGNVLVTNSVPDLYKVKGLAERIYVYNTVEGAKDFIDQIMKEKIEYTDTDYIKKNHMLPNRINSILGMIESKVQQEF